MLLQCYLEGVQVRGWGMADMQMTWIDFTENISVMEDADAALTG